MTVHDFRQSGRVKMKQMQVLVPMKNNGEEGGGYQFPQVSPDLPINDSPEIYVDSTLQVDNDVENTIEKAREYAKQGKLIDAEITFSKALIVKPSENQLLKFASFLIDTGQLGKATVMVDRAVDLAFTNNNMNMLANAYSGKGIILRIKGNLDGAKDMFEKSLEIAEKAGFNDIKEISNQNLKGLRQKKES